MDLRVIKSSFRKMRSGGLGKVERQMLGRKTELLYSSPFSESTVNYQSSGTYWVGGIKYLLQP
jgi:hypothetical protein